MLLHGSLAAQEGESLFEYMVSANGQWQHWREHVEEYMYPDDSVPEYASILVPNVDNVRTAFLVDNSARHGKAVLLIGVSRVKDLKPDYSGAFITQGNVRLQASKGRPRR